MVTNECAKRKKITRGLACKLIATFNFFLKKSKGQNVISVIQKALYTFQNKSKFPRLAGLQRRS